MESIEWLAVHTLTIDELWSLFMLNQEFGCNSSSSVYPTALCTRFWEERQVVVS